PRPTCQLAMMLSNPAPLPTSSTTSPSRTRLRKCGLPTPANEDTAPGGARSVVEVEFVLRMLGHLVIHPEHFALDGRFERFRPLGGRGGDGRHGGFPVE